MDTTTTSLAAAELTLAGSALGADLLAVARDDRYVTVTFGDLRDAEVLMAVAVPEDGPGSMYDRSTGGCKTVTEAHLAGQPVTAEEADALVAAAWLWDVHPNATARRMDWHVAVAIPVNDVIAIVAALAAASLDGVS